MTLALARQRDVTHTRAAGWPLPRRLTLSLATLIVLLALWTVEPLRVAWSVAGAVALNLVLAMNHRPGRYMAV